MQCRIYIYISPLWELVQKGHSVGIPYLRDEQNSEYVSHNTAQRTREKAEIYIIAKTTTNVTFPWCLLSSETHHFITNTGVFAGLQTVL